MSKLLVTRPPDIHLVDSPWIGGRRLVMPADIVIYDRGGETHDPDSDAYLGEYHLFFPIVKFDWVSCRRAALARLMEDKDFPENAYGIVSLPYESDEDILMSSFFTLLIGWGFSPSKRNQAIYMILDPGIKGNWFNKMLQREGMDQSTLNHMSQVFDQDSPQAEKQRSRKGPKWGWYFMEIE